ncbi:MAG: amidohydrolase [Vicinamibacterales bacterium]
MTSLLLLLTLTAAAAVQTAPAIPDLDARIAAVEQDMIRWRRHLHEHPELSNREVETAKYVADTLRSFGLEPRAGVARNGVVAVLKGAAGGPVVALRSDMDGLPVTEETGLPFASRVKTDYGGRSVGVMHACGHDSHMAMLLATARVLTGIKDRLRGTVVFIFQPAEESVPPEERPAGAELMVKEGVLKDPRVDAIFGLHVYGNMPSGHVAWRSGPMMAAADAYEIVVRGRQTHGATPWAGVDPIVVAAQIVTALQTIVARQVDITAQPAIVTVGQFEAGVRNNIIPDTARLVGTIRTFDAEMRKDIHARVQRTAGSIAEAAGATADVRIDPGYPVTVNNPALTERMLPTLRRVLGDRLFEGPKITGAEDFSYFQQQVPGLFLLLGITPPAEVGKAPQNHSPRFTVDEAALLTGVRTLVHLTLDYGK